MSGTRRRCASTMWLWALFGLATLLAACGSDGDDAGAGAALRGAVREPAPLVGDVELLDDIDGVPFALQADDGEILTVYFGYTSCPDVCPTTMADLRSALQDLGDDAGQVDVAMITVDPERDTPEVLTSYVDHFFDGAHALRAMDDTELRAAADRFGADYELTTDPETGAVDVAHSAWLYAVDDTGALRVQWAFGTDWRDIAADLRALLESDELTD